MSWWGSHEEKYFFKKNMFGDCQWYLLDLDTFGPVIKIIVGIRY